MESVEFYARLLWQSMQVGGPQELNDEQVQRLYETEKTDGTSQENTRQTCAQTLKLVSQAAIHAVANCGGSSAAAPEGNRC